MMKGKANMDAAVVQVVVTLSIAPVATTKIRWNRAWSNPSKNCLVEMILIKERQNEII
jgi:hypothetical protein